MLLREATFWGLGQGDLRRKGASERRCLGLAKGWYDLSSLFPERVPRLTNSVQGETLDSTVSGVGSTVGGPLGGLVGNVGRGTVNLVTGVTGGVSWRRSWQVRQGRCRGCGLKEAQLVGLGRVEESVGFSGGLVGVRKGRGDRRSEVVFGDVRRLIQIASVPNIIVPGSESLIRRTSKITIDI